MQSLWFKGRKTKEQKEERKKEVMSFRNAFDELRELLQEEETPVADYDSPSWAYKQADVNGYNRAIRHVLKLIEIKG